MMQIKRFIVAAVGGLAVGAAVQASVMPWTVKAMRWQASTSTVTAVVPPAVVTNDFTIRFLTGVFPTTLTVGMTPSVTNAAQYDPGDGVWRVYSARTITLAAGSTYISFRGSWTNSSRTYQSLFSSTFTGTTYTCQAEGAFSNTPATINAYYDMFLNARAIVSFATNPVPLLTGAAGGGMLRSTFYGMSGLTSLPVGFMDTTSITGAPALNMFYRTFQGCSSLTNIPAGTLSMSGLSGTPATNMCNQTFYGCSAIVSGDFNMSSNITFTSNNIALSMPSAFANMTKWTGTVYWGSSRIYDAIPNPATDANVFQNSTNVPGYSTTMQSNWK
jgi:hypothetical protein